MTGQVPAETVDLAGGGRMPLVGLGTWALRGRQATEAVGWALELGYRHVDTATAYDNEAQVGAALKASGLPRDDLFVTTKCPAEDVGRAGDTLRRSLDALGTDHVDLWLVHWPTRGRDEEMWEAFVQARDEGLARDIGVSNFSLAQLDAVADATGVRPAVNQVPWSPLRFDRALVGGHRDRDVALEGYSPFKKGAAGDATVRDVAERLGRTPQQVIVRWHLQHRVVVIPKSSKTDRLASNADVTGLELSAADMAALDALVRA